jgi:hypothetical protein
MTGEGTMSLAEISRLVYHRKKSSDEVEGRKFGSLKSVLRDGVPADTGGAAWQRSRTCNN